MVFKIAVMDAIGNCLFYILPQGQSSILKTTDNKFQNYLDTSKNILKLKHHYKNEQSEFLSKLLEISIGR